MLESLPAVERMFNKIYLPAPARTKNSTRVQPPGGIHVRQAARIARSACARRPGALVGSVGRSRHPGARLGRGDRAGDDRDAVSVALGRVSAGLRHRGLAACIPPPDSGGGGRARQLADRLCLLPRARAELAPGAALHHRALGRGSRDRDARDRGRGGDRRPRAPQGRDRGARRSAPHGRGGRPVLVTGNGTGPINESVDPLTCAERLELSCHEVQTLTALGMPGVWTWNLGDDFAHLYLDAIATNHNADGRGYETFGNGTAETLVPEQPENDTSVEWYRPLPPPAQKSFTWSARDNVNYNETAMLAALDDTAQQSKRLLENYYLKAVHSYRRGLEQSPYAFLIPDRQGDPARVAQLVARLLAQGIEVHRAATDLTLKEGSFAAGTYVVRLDQPYRDYALDLLSAQSYPKEGGEAYDDVSWELPAHYHLAAIATADPAVRGAQLTALGEAPRPRGQVLGEGPVYVLADTGQEGLLEARYRLARFTVGIAERAVTADGGPYPAGSWILAPQSGLAAALTQTAETLGLDFASTRSAPEVASHAAPAPRLGLWVPWADTDTIGWARYTLDQRHIPYIYVRDEDIRAGRLRDKYDVLLYGHVDLELAEQIQGIPRAWGPMPFKKTRATPSLGTPAESDDITGGIGWSGVAELQRFVDSGGLLITLGNGSMLPLESGIVRGVRRESGGVPRSTQGGGAAAAAASQSSVTRTPGAHVRVSFARPDHPIAYGYGARTYVFRQNFARYSIPRRRLRMAYCTTCLDGPLDTSAVVLEWGEREGAPFVVSGQAWGEENLIGHPAILDLRSGAGHVIAFNFNPLHRDLNRGDQRLLWNAIINWP